ncbi:MAG: hypothetical protein E3J21_25770 [Anaerolineales bacterium]|nr:MAG: hypothetical protein E3J21_25770 [Anaerolineales bacterium]
MNKSAIVVEDYFGLPERRHALMERIRSRFAIPSTGVVFVLEKENYQDYPNSVWRQMAVHLSIKDAPLEEASPDHLLRLMKSCKYSNLIWLSRQACEARDIEFAWILSHELRHLEQDLSSHALSRAGHFLRYALGGIDIKEPKMQNTIPTELDANLRALTVTRGIFGDEYVDSYIQHESSVSEREKQDFDVLKSHDYGKRYDVFGRTVTLLRKYRSQLEEFQKQSTDRSIANFDIERVCLEPSAGPRTT